MRDTPTVWPLAVDGDAEPAAAELLEAPEDAGELAELEELEELEELHAASAAVAQRAAAAYSARRPVRRRASPRVALFVELSMLLRLSGVGHGSTLRSVIGRRC
jgi:hypothetical protein